MIAVLSPAKSLDFSPAPTGVPCTVPERLAESTTLIEAARTLSPAQLASLMDLSESLATLNHERFIAWTPDFTAAQKQHRAKQALLAFDGDVYQGFDLNEYTPADYSFAQKHLRILSGLHGLLRPLDLIQPYRLEMGRPLKTARGHDLYTFWGDRPASTLRRALREAGGGTLVNLASEEYFRAVDVAALRAPVVQPVFQDRRGDAWKVVSFNAKRARGAMTRWAIERRIDAPEALKGFDADGWAFDARVSDTRTWVFRRESASAVG
jgi:cytoplasmic iron level regulating protein YaaA (DUF328/UPF0246 family)